MKLKAVIFDKDGVLIDTEEGIVESTQKTLKKFGGNASWFKLEDRIWTGGISANKTFSLLREKYSLDVPLKELLEAYNNNHVSYLKDNPCKVLDGALELLKMLREQGIKIGVGTGSTRFKADLTIKQAGIDDFIDVSVSVDDVQKPKPAPDTFLEAARRLNILPSECVVIGDSHNDRIGAKSAGMKFVFRTEESFKIDDGMEPDIVVKSLTELKLLDLENLFK